MPWVARAKPERLALGTRRFNTKIRGEKGTVLFFENRQ
jgi:hypothetical protein